jgi:transcriptional regulator with XRE-family HTH domain
MSQQQLAEAAGLHLNTVQRVERETDASRVHRLTWVRLSRALGLPREDLVP